MPTVEVPVFFLEPERKLGATVRFSGRSASGGPVTVRLEPCGTARARLVDPDGKPLDRYRAASVIVDGRHARAAAPEETGEGRSAVRRRERPVRARPGQLHASTSSPTPRAGSPSPRLIPGATYRIVDLSPVFGGGDPAIRKEFTVKPGEALDLGDILIAKPRRRNSP